MANLDAVAEQAFSWAERNKAIVELAEAIKEIGSLDQALAERRTAVAAVSSEHRAVALKLEAAVNELTSARKSHSDEAKAHEASLAGLLSESRAEADRIIGAARAAGDSIVSGAQAIAGRAQADATAQLTSYKASLEALQSQVGAAEEALAMRRAEHEAIVQRTEQLRQAAKSVLA